MEKNKKIVLPSISFVYKHSRLRGTTSKCDVSTCNSITTQRERASKNSPEKAKKKKKIHFIL
jgi:hypothetical protein